MKTDEEILAERLEAWNERSGPRVGDWVLMQDGSERRFTHDWGDGIQTTTLQFGLGRFYLGSGYMSYSGGLDPCVPKTRLNDTGETRLGWCWFFHQDMARAHNGVDFQVACRVFKETIKTIWNSDGTDGPVLICTPGYKEAE